MFKWFDGAPDCVFTHTWVEKLGGTYSGSGTDDVFYMCSKCNSQIWKFTDGAPFRFWKPFLTPKRGKYWCDPITCNDVIVEQIIR